MIHLLLSGSTSLLPYGYPSVGNPRLLSWWYSSVTNPKTPQDYYRNRISDKMGVLGEVSPAVYIENRTTATLGTASLNKATFAGDTSQGAILFNIGKVGFPASDVNLAVFSQGSNVFTFKLFYGGGTHSFGIVHKVGATTNAVRSTIPISTNLMTVIFGSDGSSYKIWMDGVPLTLTVASGSNNGDWFAELPSYNSLTLLDLTNKRITIAEIHGTTKSITDQEAIDWTTSNAYPDINIYPDFCHYKIEEGNGSILYDASQTNIDVTLNSYNWITAGNQAHKRWSYRNDEGFYRVGTTYIPKNNYNNLAANGSALSQSGRVGYYLKPNSNHLVQNSAQGGYVNIPAADSSDTNQFFKCNMYLTKAPAGSASYCLFNNGARSVNAIERCGWRISVISTGLRLETTTAAQAYQALDIAYTWQNNKNYKILVDIYNTEVKVYIDKDSDETFYPTNLITILTLTTDIFFSDTVTKEVNIGEAYNLVGNEFICKDMSIYGVMHGVSDDDVASQAWNEVPAALQNQQTSGFFIPMQEGYTSTICRDVLSEGYSLAIHTANWSQSQNLQMNYNLFIGCNDTGTEFAPAKYYNRSEDVQGNPILKDDGASLYGSNKWGSGLLDGSKMIIEMAPNAKHYWTEVNTSDYTFYDSASLVPTQVDLMSGLTTGRCFNNTANKFYVRDVLAYENTLAGAQSVQTENFVNQTWLVT